MPSASTLQLIYGLCGEQLLHVSQVANGLACACRCPGCGARLVARNQGQRKRAHFAHHQAEECHTGAQTALHLAAKEIIARHGQLLLPGQRGYYELTPAFWASFAFDAAHYESCLGADDYKAAGPSYAINNRYIRVDAATLERKTGDVIPDILLTAEGTQLLVEVAVTHFVDAEKLAKLRALGIATLEIDLSHLRRDITLAELEELLIHGAKHKRWVFNPKLEARLAAGQQRFFARVRPLFEQAHAEELDEEAQQVALEQLRQQVAARQDHARHQVALVNKRRYKPVTPATNVLASDRAWVTGCPRRLRVYQRTTYADLDADCHRCPYFRGYYAGRAGIICVGDS